MQIILKYPSLLKSDCSYALGQTGPFVICQLINLVFLKKSSSPLLADLKPRSTMTLWKCEMDGHTQHPWLGFTMGPKSPSSSSAPATTSIFSSPPIRVTRTSASSSAMRVSLRVANGWQDPGLCSTGLPRLSRIIPVAFSIRLCFLGHPPLLSASLRAQPLEVAKVSF